MLGVLIAKVRWCESLLDPVIEALRPVPTLALLPMIILWFGIGETSKVFFIAYSCFFVIFTTTVLGVRNVDPIFVRAAPEPRSQPTADLPPRYLSQRTSGRVG